MTIELPHWLAQMAPAIVGLPFTAAMYWLAHYTAKHAYDKRD